MNYKILFSLFVAVFQLGSCSNAQQTKKPVEEKPATQTGRKNAVRIGAYQATPKATFEYTDHGISADTLRLVACAGYVWHPFGEITHTSQFKAGLLKDFEVNASTGKKTGGFNTYDLSFRNSHLLVGLPKESTEGNRQSYIGKGLIRDKEVILDQGVRIGMSEEDFLMTFFESFPAELREKYDQYALETCVADLQHHYTFKGGKLASITFKRAESF